MRFADHATAIADVLLSEVTAEGEVRVNLGDVVTGDGFGAFTATWGADGFVARPLDPVGGEAARALFIYDGQSKRILGMRDARYAAKVGSLQPGDRAIVSDCEARFFLKRATNALTLYTTNDTDDGNAMMVHLDGAAGEVQVRCSDVFALFKKGEITLAVNGGGSIIIDANGVQIGGQKFSANAATVTLGLLAGAPPPPGVSSALIGPSGLAGVPSTSVTIAP
jgi:hypothetical protein